MKQENLEVELLLEVEPRSTIGQEAFIRYDPTTSDKNRKYGIRTRTTQTINYCESDHQLYGELFWQPNPTFSLDLIDEVLSNSLFIVWFSFDHIESIYLE